MRLGLSGWGGLASRECDPLGVRPGDGSCKSGTAKAHKQNPHKELGRAGRGPGGRFGGPNSLCWCHFPSKIQCIKNLKGGVSGFGGGPMVFWGGVYGFGVAFILAEKVFLAFGGEALTVLGGEGCLRFWAGAFMVFFWGGGLMFLGGSVYVLEGRAFVLFFVGKGGVYGWLGGCLWLFLGGRV